MIVQKEIHVCDFCGKDEREVKKIIAGPTIAEFGKLCICDECVDLAVDIVDQESDAPSIRRDAERYRALRFGSSVPLQHDTDVGFKLYSTNWRGNGFAKIEIVTPESLDAGADLLIEKEKNNG